MNWYLKVLKQYADGSGRARRKEYWMFTLFNIIVIASFVVLDKFTKPYLSIGGESLGYWLYLVYVLAIFIPAAAVSIRRLHDTGHSGWMLLLGLIPIIGSIWLMVLYATDSQSGENKYGPNPKG